MNNVADEPEYAKIKTDLMQKLAGRLASTGDPRETGGDTNIFDESEYHGGGPWHPSITKPKKNKRKNKNKNKNNKK